MADPERFDADPDPDTTFQADVDPDQKFVNIGRKFFFSNLHFFLLYNLTKLSMCNFLSNTAGGRAWGEG